MNSPTNYIANMSQAAHKYDAELDRKLIEDMDFLAVYIRQCKERMEWAESALKKSRDLHFAEVMGAETEVEDAADDTEEEEAADATPKRRVSRRLNNK